MIVHMPNLVLFFFFLRSYPLINLKISPLDYDQSLHIHLKFQQGRDKKEKQK